MPHHPLTALAPEDLLSQDRLFGDRTRLRVGMVFGVLLLAAFGPTLVELVDVWIRWPEYGHGLLMPPVAAWLVWSRRRDLATLRPAGGVLDATLRVLAALALIPLISVLLLGELKLWWGLKPFAFLGAVTASITLVWGARGVWALRAPLLVLLVMCPLPYRLHTDLTLPLKRHAAVLATGLLDLSGLEATLEGNLIHVPGIEALYIADACSGIRSLISLVSVAILACILWPRHWIQKAIVVLSCVPIAIAVNGMRIWLTGMLSVHVSPAAAQGFFHIFEGFLLFGFAAVLLWGWAALLDRVLPLRRPDTESPKPGSLGRPSNLLAWGTRGLALVLLLAAAIGVYRIRTHLGPESTREEAARRLAASFERLPPDLASDTYRGERIIWDEAVIEASGADAYVSIIYSDRAGRTYQVYVGGALRNDENFHSPNVCMPAAGWEALEKGSQAFPGSGAEMERMLLQRGTEQMLVYYWFQIGAHRAANEFDVRMRRVRDFLAGTPLAPSQICTIYVPVRGGVEATEEAALGFLRVIEPHLHEVTTSGEIHG